MGRPYPWTANVGTGWKADGLRWVADGHAIFSDLADYIRPQPDQGHANANKERGGVDQQSVRRWLTSRPVDHGFPARKMPKETRPNHKDEHRTDQSAKPAP